MPDSHATAKDIEASRISRSDGFPKTKKATHRRQTCFFCSTVFHFQPEGSKLRDHPDSPDPTSSVSTGSHYQKFGQVLECDHGKPIGTLTVTKSGLTCGDGKNGHVTVNGSKADGGHELRAGRPDEFRIVGVDDVANGKTKFGLVALVLPKDDSKK